jgi:hypothetical protein
MATLQELLNQRDAAINRKNTNRTQFEQASIPVTGDDATRYLNEKVASFQPWQEEQRNLMSQSAQILPSQIQQFVNQKNQGMSGPSSLTALNSIFRNQANTQQQANLIGDQIETARGRLGQLANSGLQQLGQKQASLRELMGMDQNDIARFDSLIAQEQARQEAAAARARAAAASSGGGLGGISGGLSGRNTGASLASMFGDGGSISLNDERGNPTQQPNFVNNVSNLGNNLGNAVGRSGFDKFIARPVAQDLYRNVKNLQDLLVPKDKRIIGNGKPLLQDIKGFFGMK